MRLFAVLLVVSFIIHVGLFAIPLPEKKLEKKEVIPVSIVSYKKLEQKKEKPKKQQKPKPVEKNNEIKKERTNVDDKKVAVKQQIENKPFRPIGADEPLVLPDINVPIISNDVMPEITVPDISKLNIDVPLETVENQKSIDIAKELSSLNDNANKINSDNDKSELQQETENAVKTVKSSLYNFDIAPAGNRKVVYLPPDPVFALANDTKITVRFNIDKTGNTYNIIFITRSSIDVEKLALNYVSHIKFDAIIENREDFAQITMQFKVQK